MTVLPPPATLVNLAIYSPETAVAGTLQLTVTDQFPQSVSPVVVLSTEQGLFTLCAVPVNVVGMCSIRRAPFP